jgi:hypothetical protein
MFQLVQSVPREASNVPLHASDPTPITMNPVAASQLGFGSTGWFGKWLKVRIKRWHEMKILRSIQTSLIPCYTMLICPFLSPFQASFCHLGGRPALRDRAHWRSHVMLLHIGNGGKVRHPVQISRCFSDPHDRITTLTPIQMARKHEKAEATKP